METKIRLRFSKADSLRYIGHLDFLRVFQQMIRRAGLPIAYSQGFNPHQILSFALPLPLGMESLHDYADITLVSEVCFTDIISRLNNNAPHGLCIHDAYIQTGQSAAAATAAADYTVHVSDISRKTLTERAQGILQAEALVVSKKTKSGVKDTDIRPDIYTITISENVCRLRLSAGSAKFLNPLLVAELLLGHTPCTSTISRDELYQLSDKGGLIPL